MAERHRKRQSAILPIETPVNDRTVSDAPQEAAGIMGRSLYDILDVSNNASPESIRAAYERLSAKFAESSGIPDAKLQGTAVTEAFLTLGNPDKRSEYDKTLAARAQPIIYSVEAVEPFWTLVPPVSGTVVKKLDPQPAYRGRGDNVAPCSPCLDPRYSSQDYRQDQYNKARQQQQQQMEDARKRRMAELEAECDRNRGTDCSNPEVLRYIESTSMPRLPRPHR